MDSSPHGGGGGSAPANSVPPAITGGLVAGTVQSVSNGTWINVPTSYAYQWTRNGTPIPGATSNVYVPVTADVGTTLDCTVTASNAAGSASQVATGGGTVTAGASAPTNTVAPAITGTLQQGQTASVSNGTWTGSPTSYAYQWTRNGSNITGATSATYVMVLADVGTTLGCLVTATNGAGSSSPVAATGGGTVIIAAPVNSVLPAITGSLVQGSTVSVSQGTWTNSPASYTYQWTRNGSPIGGATSSTYLLAGPDVGNTIGATVTASNAGGSSSPATATGGGTVSGSSPSLNFSINTNSMYTPLLAA
jgi:hypothetical protein